MNKKCIITSVFILIALLLTSWTDSASAQATGDNERYNLAVYATGIQNDQPLSTSLLTVVQNKTITKLTGEGNYRLIERSGEFLKEIQNEQNMQQSGEVADGQIAELGAGYGAQKVCVVSVTIIDHYLYIATRIVDVTTKTSYESGDAEDNNFTSIPILTGTLDKALNKMLSFAKKTISADTPTQPKESIESANLPSTALVQPLTPQLSENNISRQTEDPAGDVSKAEVANDKAKVDLYLKAYEEWVVEENGSFLDVNSMAYKEYRKYRANLFSGLVLVSAGIPLSAIGLAINSSWTKDFEGGLVFMSMWGTGLIMTTVGIIQLCCMNNHLKKSYYYFLKGDQYSVSLQFYPYYYCGNNTLGAGLSLRF
ncbi:MAG: hypothetical protein J6X98_07440 [Bacteroidales bacterium]|nr:hypothetical protein [Bacteroidales bacterium]